MIIYSCTPTLLLAHPEITHTLTKVKIKENSWLAKIAARKLDSSSMAMVVGRTIHLHNSSKADFLRNKRWVRHEVAHVKQYAKLGILRFIFFYLLESFNKGYENNSFEIDARQKEKDLSILSEVHFN
ncbi:MAG: hypothetical protein JWR87_742 [Segetibacter sp.]|jgi:hypothetical protein|nr:hypothetical protein [Segetibacter sp.]